MKRKRILIIAVVVAVIAIAAYRFFGRSGPLVLTGIVTTNDVIVSPQVAGQVQKLLVSEGDSVTAGQLIAVIAPGELAADQAYYAHSAQGQAVQVQETEAALRYQEQQTTQQIKQAEATLASAQRNYDRIAALLPSGAVSQQTVDQQRTTLVVAKAKTESMDRQVDAQRAALELARSQEEQVAMKRHALGAARQEHAAATAQ